MVPGFSIIDNLHNTLFLMLKYPVNMFFGVFSDKGVLERHNQLENTIGVFDIELKSLERSLMFTWIFYPTWIISAIIQAACFILSNGRFHPLAKILKGCQQSNCRGIYLRDINSPSHDFLSKHLHIHLLFFLD